MPDEPLQEDTPPGSGDSGPPETVDADHPETVDSDHPESTTAKSGAEPGGRSVVVPDRVYKTVTVFSTLVAVVTVVGGFVVLDRATNRAQAPLSEINPWLALAGLGLIVFGAVTYAFSTRFEAEGMGNAKDDTDEPSNNG